MKLCLAEESRDRELTFHVPLGQVNLNPLTDGQRRIMKGGSVLGWERVGAKIFANLQRDWPRIAAINRVGGEGSVGWARNTLSDCIYNW